MIIFIMLYDLGLLFFHLHFLYVIIIFTVRNARVGGLFLSSSAQMLVLLFTDFNYLINFFLGGGVC